MTEEKKTEEKKAADKNGKAAAKKDAPEQTEQQKWDAEHLDLVAKLQEAKAALFDHRNPTAEAVEAAKAATKTTVKSGVDTIKKGAEKVANTFSKDDEEPKSGTKGPLAKESSTEFRPDKY